MRIVCSVFATVTLACAIAGCGPKITPGVSMERQQKYGRLAIICVPKLDANPAYAPMILKEAGSMISHLRFLEKVDCLPEVPIDTTSTPPIVDSNDVSDYDAVVSLVYYYDLGHVYLDFYMTDTVTAEQIWYHQFDSPDPSIKERLLAHGLSAPGIIKTQFYGL
jgi:hypothetical protein